MFRPKFIKKKLSGKPNKHEGLFQLILSAVLQPEIPQNSTGRRLLRHFLLHRRSGSAEPIEDLRLINGPDNYRRIPFSHLHASTKRNVLLKAESCGAVCVALLRIFFLSFIYTAQ